jgi:phospholipid-binding lipoprotein MlaA
VRKILLAGWSILATLACIELAGCATSGGERASPDDPFEATNRAVLDVNTALDNAVIRPVAEFYRNVVPPFARDRIRSMIDNLAEPRVFANDLLQFRINAAGITFTRFVLNSTFGLAGMFDVAKDHDLPPQSGDFGETLYAWGFDEGPYLMLLFFGPSNLRDTVGLGVDLVTTPPGVFLSGNSGFWIGVGVGTVDGMDLRSRNIETLDQIIASSLDYYSHLKSIAQQHRRAQLRDVREPTQEPAELLDPGEPGVEPQH